MKDLIESILIIVLIVLMLSGLGCGVTEPIEFDNAAHHGHLICKR